MITSLVCLAVLQATQQNPIFIPDSVSSLVKNRIATQYSARNPGYELIFDRDECPQKTSYFFAGGTLVIEGKSDLWSDRKEYRIVDIVEGSSLEMPVLPPLETLPNKLKAKKSFVPSTKAILLTSIGLGVVGLLTYKLTHKSQAPTSPVIVSQSSPTTGPQPFKVKRGLGFTY